MRVVIDTNVFVESLSRTSPYHAIFQNLKENMAARNQKNKRPKQKKNKRKKPLSAGMARLVQRVPNLNLPAQQKVLINSPELEKMSEVILDFAQPLLDMSDNDEATQKAINFAIVAWNFAIIKE